MKAKTCNHKQVNYLLFINLATFILTRRSTYYLPRDCLEKWKERHHNALMSLFSHLIRKVIGIQIQITAETQGDDPKWVKRKAEILEQSL